MDEWHSISDFVESELKSSSCANQNPQRTVCSLSQPCHLSESSIEEFKIFGLPVSPDQPCVGIYPSPLTHVESLYQSYHTTLSSLYPQQLIIIVLLSHLMTSQASFRPFQLFTPPSYQGIDRTHMLVNPAHNWTSEVTESSEWVTSNPQLSDMALLSSYASYSLKCSSFIALESGMVASLSLDDKMRSLTHEGRTNLASHLEQSSLIPTIKSFSHDSKDNVKVLLPVYRLSRITGSHLLVLNLDERRNYISKLAQTASKFQSTSNSSTAEFLQLFSHLQSAITPKFILPPLVSHSVDLKGHPKMGEFDLHPDMELMKQFSPTALNVTIKATYTQVSQDGEYESRYVVEPRGYFQTKEVYARDTFAILFTSTISASRVSIVSGSPNQPNKKIESGNVVVSNLGSLNSKSGKVLCNKTKRLGAFDNGTFYYSSSEPAAIKCIVIYFGSYQPEGVIIYHVQLIP